jgi:DNA-binding response OmpR family regulator
MGARILVVDDSPTVGRVVVGALSRAGHEVVLAKDGADAVAQTVTAAEPELLVVDFVMPGLGGLQVLSRITERLERTIPTILMCTRTDPLPRRGLEQLGVMDTITKPFSPDAITAVVENALERMTRDKLDGLGEDDDDATVPMRPEALAAQAEHAEQAHADLTRALAGALHARGVGGAEDLADRLASAVAGDEELKAALGQAFDDPRPLPVLYGDLEAVELPEVLQLLKMQGQTGILEVVLRSERFEAALREGRIISIRARDAQAEQRLGRYFVRGGALSAEELQTYLRAPEPRAAIGQRLLDDERIDEEQLYDALQAQAHDLMYEILRARGGFFALRRGEENLPRARGPGLSVDSVLFEALRRVDEWRVIEREVSSFDAPFRIVGEAARIDKLSDEEAEVLKLVASGTTTAQAIAEKTEQKPFDTAKMLYRLVVLQRIEPAGGAA